jgi:hypothetical protein
LPSPGRQFASQPAPDVQAAANLAEAIAPIRLKPEAIAFLLARQADMRQFGHAIAQRCTQDRLHLAPNGLDTNQAIRLDLGFEHLVEARVPGRARLPLQGEPLIVRSAVAQHFSRNVARGMAQSPADIVTGNDEFRPVAPAATEDDVDVRVVRVVMIDRDPIEFEAQVALHARHRRAGEVFQILDPGAAFGRQHQAEVSLVGASPFLKPRHALDLVVLAVVEAPLLTVRSRAVALEILAVSDQPARGPTAMALIEHGRDDALARVCSECGFDAFGARTPSAPRALGHKLRELRAKAAAARVRRSSALLHFAFKAIVVAKHMHVARCARGLIALVGPHQRR